MLGWLSEPEEGRCPRCCLTRWSTPIASDDAWLPCRSTAAQQGLRYPADPPKVEEIVAVMRMAGDDAHGRRLRGLIVVLWRAGLRIQEALALAEADLDYRRGALLVRSGKADVAAKSAWTRGERRAVQT